MGGATIAHALAPTGARIVIIDKGYQLPERPENRDARAIFQRGVFRPDERWHDGSGNAFSPGNYYCHGGNSKFYGAVLARYRQRDFDGVYYKDGDAPAWPFRYETLAPFYDEAERLYQVRGARGEDPTEPPGLPPYPHPPIPDEPAIADVRARLAALGLRPFSLPLGVDVSRWLAGGQTGWDAFPDARRGKMDAETCALLPALAHSNVTMLSGAEVERLVAGSEGRRIERVSYRLDGTMRELRASHFILSAGAVRSAAILLASGIANRSDAVGRHFMNHNASAVLAASPRFENDSVYQKTFGVNDVYTTLGNVQLLGRVTAPILKASLPRVPEFLLRRLSRHAVDFYAMSEDLPSAQSRVRLDGSRIVLDWQRSNMTAQTGLVRQLKSWLRAAGFPLILSRLFDRRTPSHQCGTIRLGDDPARAPVDPFGRAFDHPNLFVADASLLVTSAAVNPSLTVAALALRTGALLRSELGAA